MADQNDLTTNVALYEEGKTDSVTQTTDGSKERLDVSLGSELSFQLQAFTPVFTFDGTAPGVSLTTSYTVLASASSTSGKVDFIATSMGTANYKIKLTIDSVICYEMSMAELNTIGLANATNVEMWAETANKNFRHHPNAPIDFTDNMEVAAATTTGTGTLYYLVSHRVAA